MLYYYKKQNNATAKLKDINKNNIEAYQYFAFVSLFFKFVKEDYFFSGNFDDFNIHLKKNKSPYNDFYLNVCDIQKKTLENLLQNIDSYIAIYKTLIIQTVYEPNTLIEEAYCYSYKDFSFIRYLESDVKSLTTSLTLQKQSPYCRFYFIQEVSGDKKTYGIFVFKKYNNGFFAFYDPHSGIKEYSAQEMQIFEDYFKTIIKKNNNHYCIFKIKFIANKKVFFNTKETFLNHLIYVTATKYLKSIKDNKLKYSLGIGISKKEYSFVINYIKNYSKNNLNNDLECLSLFFENFYCFLENLAKENYTIQKTSFWIFFMLEYFYLDENFINAQSFPELRNNKIQPQIKEKASDLLYEKIKQKSDTSTIQLLFKFLVEHIYSEQFNYLPKNKFFNSIKFNNYSTIISTHDANKIGNAWLKTFQCNTYSTCNDWNRQRIVYNGKLISKRYDHKADHYNTPTPSPKLSNTPNSTAQLHPPLETELKTHLLSVSENSNSGFAHFCLNYCNQDSVFGLGHVLFTFLLQLQISLSFSNRIAFINKVSKNCFEFNIITYFSCLEALPNRPAKIFKTPFELCYGFLLVIENDQFKISNFHIGMLKLAPHIEPEHKIIAEVFKKILINQVSVNFSEKNTHDQYINVKRTCLNYLQSQIKNQATHHLLINI